MNKKIILLLAFTVATGLQLSAQSLNTPQPSPKAIVTQNFATSKVEVSYSRPGIKGRVIFGELVPYGIVWRTGANAATNITFGEDVNVNGMPVAAGKYGLLTIPAEKDWTIIITKDLDVTGHRNYKQENDVARFTIPAQKTNYVTENFTIEFINIQSNRMEICLRWETTSVTFHITADFDEKVMKRIEELAAKDSLPYAQAANYYLENDKDPAKALEWINKAIAQNQDAYWLYHTKAKIQMKLHDFKGALETANISRTKAVEKDNLDYVKLNDKLIADITSHPEYTNPPIPQPKKKK